MTRHAGVPRQRPRTPIARISPASLSVTGAAAAIVVVRRLLSPNRSFWAHWKVKHRDRDGWEASIKSALIGWIDSQVRTRAERLGATAELVRGELPSAPEQRYSVYVFRQVPSVRHFITDDDNLTFAVKPVLDALVSCGLIYSDRREWLDRPLPVQVVGPEQTRIVVSPFWRVDPAPIAEPPAAGEARRA
jgi:hypothetical protein